MNFSWLLQACRKHWPPPSWRAYCAVQRSLYKTKKTWTWKIKKKKICDLATYEPLSQPAIDGPAAELKNLGLPGSDRAMLWITKSGVVARDNLTCPCQDRKVPQSARQWGHCEQFEGKCWHFESVTILVCQWVWLGLSEHQGSLQVNLPTSS